MLRPLSITKAIEKLARIRDDFAAEVRSGYEHKARPCSACGDPGICCRDEHFVNVHITRLEAEAIVRQIELLPVTQRHAVYVRAEAAVSEKQLDAPGDTYGRTYACPLFVPGTGCLVHAGAKPLPCIAHACYDRREDLPPQQLLDDAESAVAELDRRVHGRSLPQTPIPAAVMSLRPR